MSLFRVATRVLCASIFATSFALFGQFESGTVLGTIHDPSGANVVGANVTLDNTKTGVTLQTKTDTNGDYEFVNARLGTYRVTVEAPGFQTASTDSFDLTVNARQRVDLTLQVGQTSQNITVSGAAELLETENSARTGDQPQANCRSAAQRKILCRFDIACARSRQVATRESDRQQPRCIV